jgi:hypothetical protein
MVFKKKTTLAGGFLVGMAGFEPAASRPPDVHSNRAELHPVTNEGQM